MDAPTSDPASACKKLVRSEKPALEPDRDLRTSSAKPGAKKSSPARNISHGTSAPNAAATTNAPPTASMIAAPPTRGSRVEAAAPGRYSPCFDSTEMNLGKACRPTAVQAAARANAAAPIAARSSESPVSVIQLRLQPPSAGLREHFLIDGLDFARARLPGKPFTSAAPQTCPEFRAQVGVGQENQDFIGKRS